MSPSAGLPASAPMVVLPELRRTAQSPTGAIESRAAYRKGVADAIANRAKPSAVQKMSTSYKGLYCSVIASPLLQSWPREVKEWLYLRCLLPAKSPTDHDREMLTREFLGLEGK